jgi:hypothetical protein
MWEDKMIEFYQKNIKNEPWLFTQEQVATIEKTKKAKYVCDTEQKNNTVAVFYGESAHPVSGSRYFALYYTQIDGNLMITDGSFIESQEIAGVVADNGDIIYSRFRHDYRESKDGSVMVDGGRSYLRTNTKNTIRLYVKDGLLTYDE